MKKRAWGVCATGLCLIMASTAAAQSGVSRPWQDRAYVNFNFGFETEEAQISETRNFTLYEEPARVSSALFIEADSIIDFSAGMRVWRNLSVGVGYSVQSTSGSGEISGSLPHPLFFDRPRLFDDEIDNVDREEAGTHLIIGWTLPFSDKLDVMVAGGPSFFRLHQDVVSGVNAAETGSPFTTVLVDPVITDRAASAWGINVGVDATYILVAQGRVRIGAGGFVRYAGANAELQLSAETVESKVGGMQFGGGLRVRF